MLDYSLCVNQIMFALYFDPYDWDDEAYIQWRRENVIIGWKDYDHDKTNR